LFQSYLSEADATRWLKKYPFLARADRERAIKLGGRNPK
jgi:hypothetical protein